MFLACTRKQIPGASICPCWLSLYVLIVIFCLIVGLYNYFLRFLARLFGISTLLTVASIEILLLLNVSTHNSTQCPCLGLQHSAA